MEGELLRVPSVLYELQRIVSEESAISSLTTLNQAITSSQEEMELFCRSDGITIIMSFLNGDSELAKMCLKILTNSSKRHEKIRRKLLQNNILRLLAVRLKKETDFSKNTLILYSVLIVVLVRGNCEAQNQMRSSECLSSLVCILSHILDEADHKPLPRKNTELFIYAITASYKDPRHTANQTAVGCITPKVNFEVLEYLEKQTIYPESDQLQLAKYFWFFLRTILDKNEMNQQIFLKSSGLSVLFRSLQEVPVAEKSEDTEDLMVKMTGVLVKLKSNKKFLFGASGYCPVMILSNLLKIRNCLVLQQIIIFLDSLTQEFPQTLQVMRSPETLKQLKQAEIILTGSGVEKLFRNLWNNIISLPENPLENSSSLNRHFPFLTSAEESTNFEETLDFLKNHFCVVHGALENSEEYSLLLRHSEALEEIKNKKDVNQRKIKYSGTHLNFHRKESREKERKLRRIVRASFSPNGKRNPFTLFGIGRKIIQTFKTFLSFFNYEPKF